MIDSHFCRFYLKIAQIQLPISQGDYCFVKISKRDLDNL